MSIERVIDRSGHSFNNKNEKEVMEIKISTLFRKLPKNQAGHFMLGKYIIRAAEYYEGKKQLEIWKPNVDFRLTSADSAAKHTGAVDEKENQKRIAILKYNHNDNRAWKFSKLAHPSLMGEIYAELDRAGLNLEKLSEELEQEMIAYERASGICKNVEEIGIEYNKKLQSGKTLHYFEGTPSLLIIETQNAKNAHMKDKYSMTKYYNKVEGVEDYIFGIHIQDDDWKNVHISKLGENPKLKEAIDSVYMETGAMLDRKQGKLRGKGTIRTI